MEDSTMGEGKAGGLLVEAERIGRHRREGERGELRRGLPVGFVWGEGDGEILLDPDEAVVNAVRNVFQRFLEFGSARKTWLWFLEQELPLPNRRFQGAEIQWVAATYHAVHMVLTNPPYAGVYAYGRPAASATSMTPAWFASACVSSL